ncbi:hypothetical protein FMUND_7427 [Fusarium mundagurra]|uniref:Uncharacterized protein n=1 Tax=Fusarium mundagurra TaxID=1567541 RepID=A0A8H5YNF7_9HYPO|nr:hypothetical protein FMUND_7427 [Fusarium mundagurra]
MINSSIESIITKRQEKECIKQVVDQLDRQVLVKVIKRLLKQGLFSDPLKAKLKFPHLFPDAMSPEEVQDPRSQENPGHHGTPSKQAPERTKINWDEWSSVAICSQEDCEDEAAEQDITSVAGMTKSQTAEDEASHARPGVEAPAVSTEATQAEEGLSLDAPDSIQFGHNTPGDHEELYLPFASQHKLMCYMQQYVEGRQLSAIDEEAAVNLFRSLADVQPVAICRVRTDSAGVKKFLVDAVRLTRILGVGDSYMVMDQFRADVERTLGSMRDDGDHFRSQLRIKLLQFQRQREVIDVQEKLALSQMERGVGECQAKAGIEVLERIKKAEEVLVIKTN